MAYPTLAELKDRLGIADGGQDALLGGVLAAAVGAVEGYCGYIWERTDSEVRTFDRSAYGGIRSVFDVSNPGLLSATAVVAMDSSSSDWRHSLQVADYEFRRYSPGGVGAWDSVLVQGSYDRLEVTGVWGQGLEAPAEVSEAVMLVAMSVYQASLSAGFVEDTPINAADWDGALIGFLLKGHRRYR